MSSVITLPADNLHRLSSIAWAVSSAPIAEMAIESIRLDENGHAETLAPHASAGLGDLGGLTASIRALGVLQPLIVTPDGRLLAGRRRLEAARRAGLAAVPVRICEIASERAAIEISLIENVERADLDPLTRAKLFRALIEQGATVDEIASLVGQGIGHVYQHLALLDLHPEVQEALNTRALSFADARTLAPLELVDQATILREIQDSPKPLSSRQVKARVDTHRVMRVLRNAHEVQKPDGDEPRGNYAALFETEDKAQDSTAAETQSNPLDQMNMIIAEMVAAAQGEDRLRAWARRLSQILGELQQMNVKVESKKNGANPAQDRLL